MSIPAVSPPVNAEPPPSDAELVARLRGGDDGALKALHKRYAGLVFAVAARLVDSATAEEVVQDVFVTLWTKHDSFDPERGTFKQWILQIARRRALNELRRTRSRRALGDQDLETLADSSVELDETQWIEHRKAAIRAAVDALPAAQRQALSLAFFDELTHEQVAAALRSPLGTTKTRIRLGLRRLVPALGLVLALAAVTWGWRVRDERALRVALALRMVTASDVTKLRLDPAPGVPSQAHGSYRSRHGSAVAVLTTSQLPNAPAAGVYVAWGRSAGGWRLLGRVAPEADGRSLLVVEVPGVAPSFDEIVVTLESDGFGGAPRGARVLFSSRASEPTP